jgi:hypothetical protein
MVGTCVSSAAGGQVGHFNQRSLMQILTQFPIPKRAVPTTFFPVLSCFPCFFLAHFMIGNLDFMQVSRCISVCRENPNSRALLKKERKKAPCPSIPGFRVQGYYNDDGFVSGLLQGCVGDNCCVSRLLLASGASDYTGQTTPSILAIDPWDCSSLPCLPHLSPVSEAG